ncbi:MAG: hypothetical protein WCJ93_00045 [Methanomicrobiales archaeon]
MKRYFYDGYRINGSLLLVGAIVLIMLSTILNRGDLSSAVLVVSGVGCFVIGIFMFTLSGGERFDQGLVNLLPVQSCITICRISGDLGLKGIAHFIQSNDNGGEVFQFNPVGAFEKIPMTEDYCFSIASPRGMILTPSGYPLIKALRKEYDWTPSEDTRTLVRGIEEVCVDIYQVAASTEVLLNEDVITVVLYDFRLLRCCREIRASASPACCQINPCPICSLIACMVTESLKKTCSFELIEPDNRNLTLGIRVLLTPVNDRTVPSTKV